MSAAWNDSVSLCSFCQCHKFLAGRKTFTVETGVLQQTSHPLPWKNPQSDLWSWENLLASCYHGITLHRVPLSSCSVDNWWWLRSSLHSHWSSPTVHLRAVETRVIRSLPCCGPGSHTACKPGSKTNYDWSRDNRINIGEAVKVRNVDSVERETFLFTRPFVVFGVHKALSGSKWNKRGGKRRLEKLKSWCAEVNLWHHKLVH